MFYVVNDADGGQDFGRSVGVGGKPVNLRSTSGQRARPNTPVPACVTAS